VDPSEAEKGLVALVQRRTGAKVVTISNLSRMSGGASRETWAFDAEIEGGTHAGQLEAIFRADPVKGWPTSPGRSLEFHTIRAAFEAGATVPEPLWDGDEDLFGLKCFVMRRIAGETLGGRLIRGPQYARARELLPAQLARTLARIHRIDHSRYPELSALPHPAPGDPPAQLEIDTYEANMRQDSKEPHAVFELALRFLRERMATLDDQIMVHGDYRLGNIIFGEEGLRAVIDWELAHFGDPMEDLGWLMVRSWRFGGAYPVAGVGEREPFFEAYEAAGGFPVDRDRVRFWEILSNLKWGIITIMQGASYLRGNKSVEHAVIGRRPAETEWELLKLIEGA
jgi:aminoglycoside phosphotransferase (APT) family kinase protein